jgi:DNA repair protein RadC
MCDFFKSKGKPVLLHSCGKIKTLIPYFIEAGYSAIQPLEAKCDQDVRELKKECFFVVCLDQKNRLIGEEQISEGTLTEALVHPREALAPAVRCSAAAVALVHNHPSGDPAPSRADKAVTKRLRDAAELLDIRLLDHVIVGDSAYFSFSEAGLL